VGIFELFSIAIGLSMDAFAVSICKGLSMKKMSWKNALIVGLYFGGFQALMPLIGYGLGTRFEYLIANVDHWVAFALLSLIGIHMIKESREQVCEDVDSSFGFKAMLTLAIATSIDALVIGMTFAFLRVNILFAISIIGIITFIISIIGVKIGNTFGNKHKSHAELAGGIILILIGIKVLLEHLGVINF
jgi:putative Mn2+ efflux pump MntP